MRGTGITGMSYKTLLIEKSDGVAILTFNRPDKKNAMNPQLHEDMTAALEELRYDDAARVLILTSRRDMTACSGSRPNGAGARCGTIPSRPLRW